MSSDRTECWEEGGVWYYKDSGVVGSGCSYSDSIQDWARNVKKSLDLPDVIQLTEMDMVWLMLEDIKRRHQQNI